MRMWWPRRVFAQVLLIQLALTAGVVALATGLFLAPLGSQLDDQAMQRALAIAKTAAVEPSIRRGLVSTRPTPDGPVQREAEQIRTGTGALYIVIMDMHGVRWSHTNEREIGRHVSTSPERALAGEQVMMIDTGTLGRSARAKVPLRDDEGRIIGAVSVGIAYDSIRGHLLSLVPVLLAYAGAALGAGVLVALLVSRRLQRRTHDLAFSDISALLAEREAMLHGIREGVIALDRKGRIRLVNDEAQRLLGLAPDDAGKPLEDVLGPGRTRDVLTGRAEGSDLLTASGGRVLVANRMPTADGGAVATLRDRTDLELLGRELDSIRGLTDALRAQEHEHANRLHTILGLLELGMSGEAADFLTELTGTHLTGAGQLADRIHEPLVAALLTGKTAIAAERRIALRVTPATLLPDRVVDPRDLVTVLGNLVDNAFEALGRAGTPEPVVEVELRAERGTAVLLRVGDNGPGVPPELREAVFTEGWTTKGPGPLEHERRHGLGLAFVRRLAERYGGTARVAARTGGGALFTVVLPEALRELPAEADRTPVEAL